MHGADLVARRVRRGRCGWCPSRSRRAARRSRAPRCRRSAMTRSPASWCGLAPLGPEPTTVKSTWECPCWRSSAARSAATSVSRRPANAYREDLLERRVGAGAGRGQPVQLGRVLDRPQHRQAVGQARVATCRGRARCSPSRCIAQARVGDRVPAVPVRAAARSTAYGSTPSSQSTKVMRRRAGGLGRVRPLQRRHDQRRRPVRAEHEHGQPLGRRPAARTRRGRPGPGRG